MAAAVAVAAATGAAIADRAKTPIQYFCSKSARSTAGRFINSFSRSGWNVPMMRLSIELRRAYGEGDHGKFNIE
jgi:hypothetical protein